MPVVEENQLVGEANAGQYNITGVGDLTNLGFTDATSYDVGETVNFKVNGDSQRIDVYRIGHYAGRNWRKVAQLVNTPTVQDTGLSLGEDSNGATQMGSWSVTATWDIPAVHVSGLHVAVVRNAALNNASWIPFVVRNDSRQADIVVGIPTSTWAAAYNYYGSPTNALGGRCLYGFGLGNALDRSVAVSYDRPIVSRQTIGQNHWDNYELPMIDWLEENGYDVKYVCSEDLHARPEAWNDSYVYMSVGHDEYWSQEMRDNVEAFRASGGHCLFVTGNDIFWRIRYADNERTIWCYKDTMPGPNGPAGYSGHVAGSLLDPVSWTGTWRDTRWAGREPENAFHGTTFRMNGVVFFDAVISSDDHGGDPFWRGTSVENSDLTLRNVIGFEANEIDVPDGREKVILGSTIVNIDGRYADNNGQNYAGNGSLDPWGILMTRKHFGDGVTVHFGTMAWAHALSDKHTFYPPVKSVDAQQSMVNLLKDLGISAGSLRISELSDPIAVDLADYGLGSSPAAPETHWRDADGNPLYMYQRTETGLIPLYSAP